MAPPVSKRLWPQGVSVFLAAGLRKLYGGGGRVLRDEYGFKQSEMEVGRKLFQAHGIEGREHFGDMGEKLVLKARGGLESVSRAAR